MAGEMANLYLKVQNGFLSTLKWPMGLWVLQEIPIFSHFRLLAQQDAFILTENPLHSWEKVEWIHKCSTSTAM
ncbi:hypothetical protein BofuT4_uP047150.1 [Botrytis cinerea T4]|uniref:Uncharacterized protein n=1 Tax=Botryotinia fuckeliana (strain T4) TaxID=999810 RepID=G2XZ10_BOTF4|nr:hypothetical protein BofuT4_uP047150.1 [Botrytis cinerea T4]